MMTREEKIQDVAERILANIKKNIDVTMGNLIANNDSVITRFDLLMVSILGVNAFISLEDTFKSMNADGTLLKDIECLGLVINFYTEAKEILAGMDEIINSDKDLKEAFDTLGEHIANKKNK